MRISRVQNIKRLFRVEVKSCRNNVTNCFLASHTSAIRHYGWDQRAAIRDQALTAAMPTWAALGSSMPANLPALPWKESEGYSQPTSTRPRNAYLCGSEGSRSHRYCMFWPPLLNVDGKYIQHSTNHRQLRPLRRVRQSPMVQQKHLARKP